MDTLVFERPTKTSIDKSRKNPEEHKLGLTKRIIHLTKEFDETLLSEELSCVFDGADYQHYIDFFLAHSQCWPELQSLIHANTTTEESGEKVLNRAKCEDEIYMLFLMPTIRNRRKNETLYEDLHDTLDEGIFNNQKLLDFCAKQPSILDTGSYILNHLTKEQILGLIKKGQRENKREEKGNNGSFGHVLSRIMYWIPKVYFIPDDFYQELQGIHSSEELSDKIFEILERSECNGNTREALWYLIQSFTTWGDIVYFEEAHNNAIKYAEPANMRSLLMKGSIDLLDGSDYPIRVEKDYKGTKIYTGHIRLDGEIHKYVWRAKSLEGALHKLGQTREFSHIDAERDMLGGTILFDDNEDQEKIARCISATRKVYANRGYILKSRGFVNRSHINGILNTKPKPMRATNIRGNATNPKLNNASVGGHVELNGLMPCGFEIQYISESGYKWKKEDDPRYKIGGIVDLGVRGESFATLSRIFHMLEWGTTEQGRYKIAKLANEEESILRERPIGNTVFDILWYGILNGTIKIKRHRQEGHILLTSKSKNSTFDKVMEGYDTIDPKSYTDLNILKTKLSVLLRIAD